MRQLQPQNLLKKLYRIRNDVDITIATLEENLGRKQWRQSNRIICDKCKGMNVRMRMDKTYFCRTCGYDSRRIKK